VSKVSPLHAAAQALWLGLTEHCGITIDRDDTVRRVEESFTEMLDGYGKNPVAVVNQCLFSATEPRSLVIAQHIEFFSLCEHHLLPFYGEVHIGYMPSAKLVGLSKLPRVVDVISRRLQVQERIASEIINAMVKSDLKPASVYVKIDSKHLCCGMRGAKKPDLVMTTFQSWHDLGASPNPNNEELFLSLLK